MTLVVVPVAFARLGDEALVGFLMYGDGHCAANREVRADRGAGR
jgi:hypothetical protein